MRIDVFLSSVVAVFGMEAFMSDLSSDRGLDLPDNVWHIASADEQIEPG